MTIIDGKDLALRVQNEIADQVASLRVKGHRQPHLVAVLVGDDPASQSYVRGKIKACDRVGFRSTLIHPPAATSENDVLRIIEDLNHDDEVDGFIVQLPLPAHIDEEKINLAIDHRKDVDGFHPMNFGRMAEGLSAYIPATPQGILLMLERYEIATEGKNCVVLGRSNIVGTPISILLSRKAYPGNATVTLAHSRTRNLEKILAEADIIVAAIGRPNFVKENMVKKGAVIIDVGINRVEDSSRKRGYRLVGDVDFEAVAPKCSFITPVPGGVGPMTVTALLMNTLKSFKKEVYA